jgi:HK97 family phage major capsid protein
MPLLATEAAKLSLEVLERGVIEEIIHRDDLFALVPFMPINGKAYLYNRENTLTEGDFLDPYDVVNEGGATFTEVSTQLRILAGDVDLDKFLITTQSDHNSQLAIQLAAKAKALGFTFRRALINGDNANSPKSFDGLAVLTPTEQTLIAGANGAAVTISMIDELRDLVTLPGGPDCYMMRRSTWRAFKALLRAMNGNTATEIMIENFGRPVPAIDGVPVILNDWISNTETQGNNAATTSIYAVRLNEIDGFHGIVGNNMAGIAVEEIGTIQNKDAVRYRVKWYVGTALKSTLSVGRLKGVTNV